MYREKVYAEQVSTLYARALIPFLTVIVNASLVAYVLRNEIPDARRLTWLGLVLTVTVLRLALWRVYHDNPGRFSLRGWGRLFMIGIGTNGILWGSMAFVLWTAEQPLHLALTAFVIGGMVAGASASAASYLPAFLTFALPAITPMAARLCLTGEAVTGAMGVMLALFGLAMILLAARSAKLFTQTTVLRLRNTDLIEHLSDAHTALERRVAERTRELEETVARLRQAESEALDAVKARNEFLAIASHELRTPLATLRLSISTLESQSAEGGTPAPGFLTGRLKTLHRQVRRLNALVDTVLAVSGLSKGPAIERREMDLAQVVRSVVDDLVVYAEPGSGHVELQIDQPVIGRWDSVRVEQVVTNLVSNALKYGGGQPVTVSLTGNGDALLTVRDRGPGIPPSDHGRIFDRFYRADAGQRAGGLGLGLFVVRELVQAMEGSISVSSDLGQGTSFIVRLPRLGR